MPSLCQAVKCSTFCASLKFLVLMLFKHISQGIMVCSSVYVSFLQETVCSLRTENLTYFIMVCPCLAQSICYIHSHSLNSGLNKQMRKNIYVTKMGRLCLWPSIRTSMGKKVNKTFIYNLKEEREKWAFMS